MEQVRVGLENSHAIICEECRNDTFIQGMYLRRVSKLLTGAADDMIANVPTFICTKCNHVNEAFQLNDVKPVKAIPKIITG